VGEHLEELADLVMALGRVPHGSVAVDSVDVASTDAANVEVPAFVELADDPLCGTLGDADACRDVAQTSVGLGGDGEQDVRVIGQKGPSGRSHFLLSLIATRSLRPHALSSFAAPDLAQRIGRVVSSG